MASRTKKEVEPEQAAPEAPAAPAAPAEPSLPSPDGVGDRGSEQNVPFRYDGAARKFVAEPHPKAGEAW